MTHDIPAPSHSSGLPRAGRSRVVGMRTLREHGVPAAVVHRRCRPGGPWRILLPGICLLHDGPPTSEERLQAALLYAGRAPIPAQPGPREAADSSRSAASEPRRESGDGTDGEPVITGLAALALHRFASVAPVASLERIDVLVPRSLRLRSAGCARIVRTRRLPRPEQIGGLPVAPAARALSDAVAGLDDPVTVRRLLAEAVRGGHCEARAVVRELGRARLLGRPQAAGAVEGLLAEARAVAEGELYGMVFSGGLPDPCWNVVLRPPGGPSLGHVDAYWPVEGVALLLDVSAGTGGRIRSSLVHRREALEQAGIACMHVTPQQLACPRRQAALVRTALMTAGERAPSEYVVVTPG